MNVPVVQCAVGRAGSRAVTVTRPGAPLRCASALKPLYVHLAGAPAWARPAVTDSDNRVTDRVVAALGGVAELPATLAPTVGGPLAAAATWGRLEVTAEQVVRGYLALVGAAASGDRAAVATLEWMRQVRPRQRFGLDVSSPTLAVKAGWDLVEPSGQLLTHAVTVTPGGKVTAALTATQTCPELRLRWLRRVADGGAEAAIALHEQAAGAQLRAALTAASAHPER